jgi:hypothetical protein
MTLAARPFARYPHGVISIQGLLGVCVVALGSALALAGCNHDDECASADDCSVSLTYAGSSGNVGAGGGNLTGDEPGQACIISADLCDWRPITANSTSALLTNVCKDQKGDVATDCPTKDLDGCCATRGTIDCFYNDTAGVPAKMQLCEQELSTWRSTAP